MILTQPEEKCADFIRAEDKKFFVAVTQALNELGYQNGFMN